MVKPRGAELSVLPVTGLSRRSTDDGLLMSAKNLYRSSSLSLSPSYRMTKNPTKLTHFSPLQINAGDSANVRIYTKLNK